MQHFSIGGYLINKQLSEGETSIGQFSVRCDVSAEKNEAHKFFEIDMQNVVPFLAAGSTHTCPPCC